MRRELDCGKPEQEIGEIETGVRERLAVGVEAAGEQAAEAERAARVGIGERVLLHACDSQSRS